MGYWVADLRASAPTMAPQAIATSVFLERQLTVPDG